MIFLNTLFEFFKYKWLAVDFLNNTPKLFSSNRHRKKIITGLIASGVIMVSLLR